MPHLPEKHLHDARQAINELQGFCDGIDEVTFVSRRDLRLIAERESEIIGEAMARLRRDFPAEASTFHNFTGSSDFATSSHTATT